MGIYLLFAGYGFEQDQEMPDRGPV